MTNKVILIDYSYLLREKTMTVVPLFLITVGIGGLVRRVVASLLSSFLLKGGFLELRAKSLLFLPHSMEGRQDFVIVSMHVHSLVGTTVQASTVSLELEALSGIVRVLMAGAHLAQFWQSLAEDLLGAEALLSPSGFCFLGIRLSGFIFSWAASQIPFHLACRTSEAA